MIRNAVSRADLRTSEMDRVAKLNQKNRDRFAAYRLVDIRDHRRCRACHRPGVEHHHIRGRQVHDAETTGNIVLLCKACHDLRHVKRTLVITGNADQALTFDDGQKVWQG